MDLDANCTRCSARCATTRVLVFSNADPEFFLAHVDRLREIADRNPDANLFQGVGELLRHQPRVTIVKLGGKARAGGAEFGAAADLTFAARETAGLGQTEVWTPTRPPPTAGSTARSPRPSSTPSSTRWRRRSPRSPRSSSPRRSGPLPAQLMTRALERGVQTPEGERDLESVMRGISATL